MSKWKIHTPEGVQDILFEEAGIKKGLEEKLRYMFKSWGYFEIETPTIEFYDAFSAGSDITPQETMFKFFDQQGRILVLRPDMTIPVARLAATKLRDFKHPLRVCYIGNAFKYNEMGGGKQREYTEAGVEVLGVSAPEADAEVIATAINAVRATGLESFQLDIGQVEFFKGLMEETGLSDEDAEQMRMLIDRKDYLGVEELVKEHGISGKLKELIFSLPGLFGSVDVIERVEKMTANKRSLAALQNLRSVLEILEDYGLSKYVSVDLGMVHSLNYYTGIIFRGFTYDVGFPIVSGGRYDNLVERFGRNCPATGFSMGIKMVMMALERQEIKLPRTTSDTLVCYEPSGRKMAVELCAVLRKQGLKVELDIAGMCMDALREYSSQKGIGGVIRLLDSENIEVYNLQTGEILKTSINALLGK